MVIVDAASAEFALREVTKITRSHIVCGRRRYCRESGRPIRGSALYAIRPATHQDIDDVLREVERRAGALAQRLGASDDSPDEPPCQLVAWLGRDREDQPFGAQTIEQLHGMAGWLDLPGS